MLRRPEAKRYTRTAPHRTAPHRTAPHRTAPHARARACGSSSARRGRNGGECADAEKALAKHIDAGAGRLICTCWSGACATVERRLSRTRRERQPGLLLSCDCESSSFGENDAKMREKTRHIIIASAAACDGCWQNRTHAFCICKARQPVRGAFE